MPAVRPMMLIPAGTSSLSMISRSSSRSSPSTRRDTPLAREFLEGKKSVPLGAVVHERGFEAGLDPGDETLVDVAFSLFFCGRFYVEVYEFLAFDNSDTEFLGLCRIKEHALHCFVLPRARAGQTKSLVSIG